MLDQLFTADNFRRIYDLENRKGHDLLSKFFPHLEPFTNEIREVVQKIRKTRSQASFAQSAESGGEIERLKIELILLKQQKSRAIDHELELVSAAAAKPSFRINLSKMPGPKGKDIFTIDKTAETYFVVKQLQVNLAKLYEVKQASRHDLVCQVRDVVSTKFPFHVLRTDIESFYENIDTKRLMRKLEEDQLISASSKRHIRHVVEEYQRLTGRIKGIPRGVGVSAYLSELFLKGMDSDIRDIDEVCLYCRYVDDIVVVFSSVQSSPAPNYNEKIKSIFDKYDLAQNQKKTKVIDLADRSSGTFNSNI